MAAAPPYKFIADGLKSGHVVPFFGAAASAVYRPPNEVWQPGKPFLPFGNELAASLAAAAMYPPDIGPIPELAVIASWAEHVQGSRLDVERELHQCFQVDSKPGLLHRNLASINGTMLYLTTNYDDLLEKALSPRQPHVIIDGGDRGLWVRVAGEPARKVSLNGDELYKLLDDPTTQRPSRPIIYKMHGSIEATDDSSDAYLITEEDYVDFLGRANDSYLPAYVSGLMKGRNFLFLGYSLADWNIRVILRKILRRAEKERVRIWAIVSGRSPAEQEIWQAHNLNIYSLDVRTFAEELAKYL
jgi:hypothetical protein